MTAIVLVTIVLFLAVDAGYFLYNPGRFTTSFPFGVLNIIRGNVQVLKKDALSWEKASSGMVLEAGQPCQDRPRCARGDNLRRGNYIQTRTRD